VLVRQYLERDFEENLFSDIKKEDLKTLVLEVETETAIEQGLVTGIITPLDTVSIALRDGRKSILRRLSKQTTASANSLLDKGKGLKI